MSKLNISRRFRGSRDKTAGCKEIGKRKEERGK
jgi:hypothetical protein